MQQFKIALTEAPSQRPDIVRNKTPPSLPPCLRLKIRGTKLSFRSKLHEKQFIILSAAIAVVNYYFYTKLLVTTFLRYPNIRPPSPFTIRDICNVCWWLTVNINAIYFHDVTCSLASQKNKRESESRKKYKEYSGIDGFSEAMKHLFLFRS